MDTHTSTPRFSIEADEALESLYTSVGALTVEHKINALKLKMNDETLGGPNFYAFGGEVSQDMILGCLEYEYLSERNLIALDLA